jgi:hypothetical protein
MRADAAASKLLVIEDMIPLDTYYSVDRDFFRQPVIEILPAFNLFRLVLIAADGDSHSLGRIYPKIDVFGEAVDNSEALGKRCAAFQLEGIPRQLQAEEAMHDPVVLFHQGRQNTHLFADDAEQVCELRVPVQIITHLQLPSQRGRL